MTPQPVRSPLVMGIAGGSGSGKTYLARQIVETLGTERAALISMDQYFRSDVRSREEAAGINFDHPSHLDFRALIRHVKQLKAGKSVWTPSYDFGAMTQTPRSARVEPVPVVVVEGLFILAEPMASLCDLTCFLDVATDERLLGRILRDVGERKTTIEEVIDRYQRFVRPSYRVFVEPTRQNADIVVDFTFRRGLFTRLLIHLVKDYVESGWEKEAFVARLRHESYHTGIHPEDGYMPMAADIFALARAYPEKGDIRDVTDFLTSPAASSLSQDGF